MDEYLLDDTALVLPAKTKLNSTAYFPLSIKDDQRSDKIVDEEISRKICNDTQIPSYRGFSIANQLQCSHSKIKPKINNSRSQSTHVTRKVSKSIQTSNKSRSIPNTPSYRKPAIQKEVVEPAQPRNKRSEDSKRVNSFWSDDHSKLIPKTEPKSIHHDKEHVSSTKYYNKTDIEAFIKRRQAVEKKNEKQKHFEKLEKEKRDYDRMKLLSLHVKEKAATPYQKRYKPILQEHNQVDEFKDSSSILSQTSSVVSSFDDNSAKVQIDNWEPLNESQIQSINNMDREQMKKMSEESYIDIEITRKCEALYKMVNDIREAYGYTRKNSVKHWPRQYKEKFLENYESLHSNQEESSLSVEDQEIRNAATQTNPLQFKVNNMKHILFSGIERSTSPTVDLIGCLRAENQKRYLENLENRRTQLSTPYKEKIHSNRRNPPHRNKDVKESHNFSMLKNDNLRFINVHRQKKKQNLGTIKTEANIVPTAASASPSVSNEYIFSVNTEHKQNTDLASKQDVRSKTDDSSRANSMQIAEGSDTKFRSTSSLRSSVEDTSSLEQLSQSSTSSLASESTVKNQSSMASQIKQNSRRHAQYRYSPSALESQFLAAIHHDDALMTGYLNLIETERLQGVSMAQQETASVVQIAELRKRQIDNMTINATKPVRREERSMKNKRSSSSNSESISSTTTIRKTSSTSKSKKKEDSVKSLTATTSDASEIQEIIINEESTTDRNKKSVDSSISIIDNVDQPDEITSEPKERSMSKTEIPTNLSYATKTTTSSSSNKSSSVSNNPREVSSNYTKASSTKKETSTISESIKELSNSKTNQSTRPETIRTEKSSLHTTVNPSYSTNTFQDNNDDDNDESQSTTIANDSVSSRSVAELLNIQKRVYALETQLTRKNTTLKKLQNKLAIKKYQKQEESLQRQIKLLNQQKESVIKEIEDLNNTASLVVNSINFDDPSIHNLSNSTTSSSTSQKNSNSQKSRSTTLPSKSASTTTTVTSTTSSTSDNTISKSGDIKTEIPSVGSETSEVKSDTGRKKKVHDGSLSRTSSVTSASTHKSKSNNKDKDDDDDDDDDNVTIKDSEKIEEIETSRSLKQLQFGDINEEYSASDHEGDESLKSISQKSNSQSNQSIPYNRDPNSSEPKYPVLNLKSDDNNKDSEVVDDKQPISARTIHSDISEIPEECDTDDNSEEAESKISSRRNQEYSDDFSEVSNTRYSYKEEDDDDDDEDISNSPVSSSATKTNNKQSESGEESRPETPPRKHQQKKMQKEDEVEEVSNSEASIGTVANKISEHILNLTLQDISGDKLEVNIDKVIADDRNDEKFDGPAQDPIGTEISKITSENIVPKLYESLNDDEDDEINDDKSFNISNIFSSLQSDETKIQYMKYLVEVNDLEVIKLMHISIDYILKLRKVNMDNIHQTNKSTCEFLRGAYRLRKLPAEILKENDDKHCIEIFNQVSDSISIRTEYDCSLSMFNQRRFLPKELIYKLILEWAYVIYELEDSDSIKTKLDKNSKEENLNLKEKSRKFKLWKGVKEPEGKKQLEPLIHNRLCYLYILTKNYDGSPRSSEGDKKSRIHKWCLDKNRDFVDRLLVDELYREDCQWQTYQPIELTLKQHLAKEIADEIVEKNIIFNWL